MWLVGAYDCQGEGGERKLNNWDQTKQRHIQPTSGIDRQGFLILLPDYLVLVVNPMMKCELVGSAFVHRVGTNLACFLHNRPNPSVPRGAVELSQALYRLGYCVSKL